MLHINGSGVIRWSIRRVGFEVELLAWDWRRHRQRVGAVRPWRTMARRR